MAQVGADGTVKMAAEAATGAAAGTAVMPGVGTVIGAGLGLLGGYLGSQANEGMSERAINYQREFAQNAIQWRVADAKAAGIHPLYAIGAPQMSVSPMFFPDQLGPAIREAGQDIGNVIEQQSTVKDKLVTALQLDILQSEAAKKKAEAGIMVETEMQMYQQRNNQVQSGLGIHNETEQVNPMGQVPAVRGTEIPGSTMGTVGEFGWYNRKAGDRVSPSAANPGWESKAAPAYQEWEVFPGFYFTTPATQGESYQELLNEMSYLDRWSLIQQNARMYGGSWFHDYMNWYLFGEKPTNKYRSIADPRGPKIPKGGLKQRIERLAE